MQKLNKFKLPPNFRGKNAFIVQIRNKGTVFFYVKRN